MKGSFGIVLIRSSFVFCINTKEIFYGLIWSLSLFSVALSSVWRYWSHVFTIQRGMKESFKNRQHSFAILWYWCGIDTSSIFFSFKELILIEKKKSTFLFCHTFRSFCELQMSDFISFFSKHYIGSSSHFSLWICVVNLEMLNLG